MKRAMLQKSILLGLMCQPAIAIGTNRTIKAAKAHSCTAPTIVGAQISAADGHDI